MPGWGRSPGKGNGYSLQYSCLENPHGQRSLVDYSPWGCKESHTTERLTLLLLLLRRLSRVQLFVTLWTVAHQNSLSMEFSRQKYWSE